MKTLSFQRGAAKDLLCPWVCHRRQRRQQECPLLGDIRTNVMMSDFWAQQTWFRCVGAVCNWPSETSATWFYVRQRCICRSGMLARYQMIREEHMRRREFITLFACVTSPVVVRAQRESATSRITSAAVCHCCGLGL